MKKRVALIAILLIGGCIYGQKATEQATPEPTQPETTTRLDEGGTSAGEVSVALRQGVCRNITGSEGAAKGHEREPQSASRDRSSTYDTDRTERGEPRAYNRKDGPATRDLADGNTERESEATAGGATLEDATAGGPTEESEIPQEHRQSEGTTDRVGTRDSGGADGVVLDPAGSFTITAYTAGYESTQKQPGEPGYGITATGTYVQEGRTIAADWNVLPPGTVVRIEGLPGNYVVEDRGGAVNGQHIDLYVADLDRAQAWGRQTRHVTIVTVQ